MAEFICRLGTPAGEIVTRTIEAVGAQEARVRLESEGFRVFAVTPPKTAGVAALTRLGTPAGEVVTRTVEAVGVQEARARLESEGFRVFAVTPPKTAGASSLTRRGGKGSHARFKANDFLLFNRYEENKS